jgi:hypothetical protein
MEQGIRSVDINVTSNRVYVIVLDGNGILWLQPYYHTLSPIQQMVQLPGMCTSDSATDSGFSAPKNALYYTCDRTGDLTVGAAVLDPDGVHANAVAFAAGRQPTMRVESAPPGVLYLLYANGPIGAGTIHLLKAAPTLLPELTGQVLPMQYDPPASPNMDVVIEPVNAGGIAVTGTFLSSKATAFYFARWVKLDPATAIPNTCSRDCDGKQCGDDACGGTCGTCPAGENCVGGFCEPGTCMPNCTGKQCGDDGCGGTCGYCSGQYQCQGNKCMCTANCSGKDCGPDGCGGSCGYCSGSDKCVGGECVCTPNCTGKTCGDNGCGGSCGSCTPPSTCVNYQCSCTPNCAGKQCGSNGCGGTCGTCSQGYECKDGACASTCMPDAYEACESGDVMTFDSCGNATSVSQYCPFCCSGASCSGVCAPGDHQECASQAGCEGFSWCEADCTYSSDCEAIYENECGGCSPLAHDIGEPCGIDLLPFISSERGCYVCNGDDGGLICAYQDCSACMTACAGVQLLGCGLGGIAACVAILGLTEGLGAELCGIAASAICEGVGGVVGACSTTCSMIGWCPPGGPCWD